MSGCTSAVLGSCCTSQSTRPCNDADVFACACRVYSPCCVNRWSELCAGIARQYCGLSCSTPPATNLCATATARTLPAQILIDTTFASSSEYFYRVSSSEKSPLFEASVCTNDPGLPLRLQILPNTCGAQLNAKTAVNIPCSNPMKIRWFGERNV
jgi:hypothetical protein